MDNPNIYNVEEDRWLSTDLQLLKISSMLKIHFLFRFNPIIAFSIPEIILLSYKKQNRHIEKNEMRELIRMNIYLIQSSRSIATVLLVILRIGRIYVRQTPMIYLK